MMTNTDNAQYSQAHMTQNSAPHSGMRGYPNNREGTAIPENGNNAQYGVRKTPKIRPWSGPAIKYNVPPTEPTNNSKKVEENVMSEYPSNLGGVEYFSNAEKIFTGLLPGIPENAVPAGKCPKKRVSRRTKPEDMAKHFRDEVVRHYPPITKASELKQCEEEYHEDCLEYNNLIKPMELVFRTARRMFEDLAELNPHLPEYVTYRDGMIDVYNDFVRSTHLDENFARAILLLSKIEHLKNIIETYKKNNS